MPVIRSRALAAIAKIFDLAGAQTVTHLDIGAAVPVLDVSRIGQYGAGRGSFDGWWVLPRDLTRTGAGQATETVSLYSDANELGVIDRTQFQAWLIDVYATADEAVATEFVNATIAMFRPAGISAHTAGGSIVPQTIYESSQLGASVSSNWGAAGAQPVIPNLGLLPRPIPIHFPGTFLFTLTTQGAGQVDLFANLLVWVGPRGALPPVGS